MRALIVTNAYMVNRSQTNQLQRIFEELTALGVKVDVKRNANVARIQGGEVHADGKYDFCVFLDKDRIAARLLEKSGLRLFNSSQAIEVCDDKMLTHVALANCSIAMPDCVYAPLCYTPNTVADEDLLAIVKSTLGFPLVAKINYGSLGASVELIKDEKQLREYESKNIHLPHFYQQFIDCGCGEDIRVIVVGGKYLCAMKRHNDNDFRSNIELGGTGSVYDADEELIKLCEKVANALNLDYCGIDILIDKNGNRYVCEVNSNAFFAAAERVCGVNVAKAYACHMIESTKNL